MHAWIDEMGCGGLQLLTKLFNRLSHRAAVRLGRWGGGVFYHLSSRRRVAYANLKSVLGKEKTEEELRLIIKKHYQNMGAMFAEVLRMPSFDKKTAARYMSGISAKEVVDGLIREKRGAIFLTAHFGNWELLQLLSGQNGQPIHVIAQPQKHPKMDAHLNRLREWHGYTTSIPTGMGLRGMFRALKEKQFIGLLGDQNAGRSEGLILPLFGRKTTVPTGAFELAGRTGSPLLPVFVVRKGETQHEIHLQEPIDCGKGKTDAATIEKAAKEYLKRLETMICRYPDQWMWGAKRWKFTWTKRLLILTDGKLGHEKQSRAVAEHFKALTTQYERPGMEYPVQVIPVVFRSAWRRLFFPFWAFDNQRSIQGRLSGLRFFFKKESAEALIRASCDFVISTGSHLTPLNRLIARDNMAKSIVLMKPDIPFDRAAFDLAVIPAHDRGVSVRGRVLRPHLSLSMPASPQADQEIRKFRKTLKEPGKLRLGILVGGSTRHYHLELSSMERLMKTVSRAAKDLGDYLVTTSRRTPLFLSRHLRQLATSDAACQLFVIPEEDPRPEVVPGIMGLCEVLIVTEDSISMISEAVSSGKRVIVYSCGGHHLPSKHKRFQKALYERGAVSLADSESLETVLKNIRQKPPSTLSETENEELRQALREIL